MRSFTSNVRVVKSDAVEVNEPRLIECPPPRLVEVNKQVRSAVWEQQTPDGAFKPVAVYGNGRALSADEARETGAQIIARAEAEAEEIHRRAEAEAEELRQEIKRQAEEEIFPAAQKDGFAQGYQDGAAAGEKYQAEMAERLADAQKQWALARRAVQEEFSRVDADLVRLAVQIAAKVIRAEVKTDPTTLLERIRALALLPQERKGWTLHLSPEDVHWIEQLKPEERPAENWIADDHLLTGDCYLECREGLFDARLAVQLDKLGQTLQEDLKHDLVEQSGPAD